MVVLHVYSNPTAYFSKLSHLGASTMGFGPYSELANETGTDPTVSKFLFIFCFCLPFEMKWLIYFMSVSLLDCSNTTAYKDYQLSVATNPGFSLPGEFMCTIFLLVH